MLVSDISEFVGEQVRNPRESRLIRAQMRGRNGQVQDIFVRNLSRFGIGARASKLAPGKDETVTVLLPGGLEVSGSVRWRSGQHFGVKLDEELELEMVSEEMRRQKNAQVAESSWDVSWLHKVTTPHADTSRLRRV